MSDQWFGLLVTAAACTCHLQLKLAEQHWHSQEVQGGQHTFSVVPMDDQAKYKCSHEAEGANHSSQEDTMTRAYMQQYKDILRTFTDAMKVGTILVIITDMSSVWPEAACAKLVSPQCTLHSMLSTIAAEDVSRWLLCNSMNQCCAVLCCAVLCCACCPLPVLLLAAGMPPESGRP